MKNKISPILCVVIMLGFISCGDKSSKSTVFTVPPSQRVKNAEASKQQEDDIVRRYVMVPNGLSLRKENTLNSEKLTVMPFRSEVLLVAEASEYDLEVEHIKGGMHKVEFDGKTGYAFSGFLSPMPMPQEEEEGTEAYIEKLKASFPGVAYEERPNDPEFHEGTTQTILMPVAQWHEAYFMAAAMFQFPKSLGFPNPTGGDLETIEDPKKPAEAWDSFLTVTRENNALKKIEYSYRAEGFGYGVDIVRESEKLFKIEYLGFVD